MVFIQLFLTACFVYAAYAANAIEVLGPNGLIGGNSVQNPTGVVGKVQNISKGGWNGSVATVGGNPTGGDALIAVAPNNKSSGISAVNVATGQGATNPGSLGSGVGVSLLDIGNGGVTGVLNDVVPAAGLAIPKLPGSKEEAAANKPSGQIIYGYPIIKLEFSCAAARKNWKSSDAVLAFMSGMKKEQQDFITQAAADATNKYDNPYDRCSDVWKAVTAKYPHKSNENSWYCVSGCGSTKQHGSYGWYMENIVVWFGDIKYEIFRPALH